MVIDWWPSMADLARREGARTEFLSSLGQPPRPHLDVTTLARIAAIARRFRPHVVHTHTAKAGFLGRLGALAALRPRPVIVHTYHGHVLEGYFGPPGSLALPQARDPARTPQRLSRRGQSGDRG